MFALLIPILASLPGLFGAFFKQKNDILTAKNEAERQIELAKINMATEIAKAQLNLNATIVQSTSSFFKYFTFVMWFGPYMIGLISPAMSKAIFENMLGMPEWYVQSCMLIMFVIWGINVSGPVVNGIFSGLGEFFQAKRNDKIELAVQVAKVDRKAYYDALRDTKGIVMPDDVKTMEVVFDNMDKEAKNG
jgi:hypothetical protein